MRYGGTFVTADALARASDKGPLLTTATASAEIRSAHRRYRLVDFAGHADVVKALTAGMVRPTAVLLAVSIVDGPMPQTRVHLQMAQRLRVPRIVVALTKTDLAVDEPGAVN